MTTTESTTTRPLTPEEPSLSLERRSSVPAWAGIALCLLLASAQMAIGGYQMGVGNQTIQIAFLQHWAHPELYNTDPMVSQTLPMYPSFFFQMLAPLLSLTSVDTLYLVGQFLTSFLTLSAVYWLARSIFRSHATALAAAALLVAGHLRALAGDAMYSQGFTHTFAALPIAIAAIALAYRGRWASAFALAGLLFNLHALTAAYALLMLSAGLFADLTSKSLKEWIVRGVLCGSVFLAAACPTLGKIATHHQTFTAEWIALMRIRSAEHSFPSTWWSAENTDLPRYLMIVALFVLSWSFSPLRQGVLGGGAKRAARITVLMTVAVLGLFFIGYVFTEWLPLPLIIRLQPFRASRLLMALMIVQIAHGAVTAIRAGVEGTTHNQEGQSEKLSPAARIAEILSGNLILLTIGIPTLLPFLPLALLAALIAGLVTGHLSWRQAAVATGALMIILLAFLKTQFPLPFISEGIHVFPAPSANADAAALRSTAATIVLVVAVLAVLYGKLQKQAARLVLLAFTVLAGGFFARTVLSREATEQTAESTPLANISAWARTETLPDTLFLTPTGLANFRITSQRAIVGDWRDGTQMYFSADFGADWLQRTADIEPGLTLSEDQKRLISRGNPLETLTDEQLIELALKYSADYIILRTPPKGAPRRSLTVAHQDAYYTAYSPVILPTPIPPGVINRDRWVDAEKFMNTTVAENIEKNRKADVTFVIVDASGKPVQNLPIKVDQTQQAFKLGASLGFFEPNSISPSGDQKPAPVRPIELEKAPELFNASMIPFSSKWLYIEPTKGNYRWSDLDKYVDYAAKHDWALEFHHLSGILPPWVEQMGGTDATTGLSFPAPRPDLQKEFDRHCLDTVARYADRIKYWQVVNEKYMMAYVPSIMKQLQKKYPKNQFGISDCVRFWDGTENGVPVPVSGRGGRNTSGIQYKGADAVPWLIQQGVKPDFFSIHGHWPLGIWPDPREMYEVFDYFAEFKVRMHITEEFVQVGGPIYGPLRTGTMTPDLAGECLARYITVAFSRPDVDLVNIWGLAPDGWGATNAGLIDYNNKPRPAWDVLKKLFTETWRSHAAGETSLEGTYLARVFHGKYNITLTLPSGKTATASVEVPQEPQVKIQLQLNPDGTLKALAP